MRPMHAPIRTIALICACLGAAACGAQQPELVTVDSPTGAEVLEVRDGMVSEFAEPDLVATKAWKLWCWVRSADGQRIIVTPRVFSLSGGETKMVPHILPATVWGDWKEVGFTFTVAEGEDRVEVRWAVAPDRPIYVAGLELSPASDPGGYENIEPPAHPYLYFRKEDIPKLAEKTRQPIAKDIWERVKQEADRLLASALPRLTGNSENTEGQLRRQYHDVVVLSFVYALTSDERYAERAKREIAAVLADEGWGEPGMLSSGLSLGLALGYDWLYDYLTDEERGRLRKAVLERGLEPIFRASYDGRIMSNRYRCNWGAVIHGNAGTAALALLGEDPRVPGWINICQEKIRLHRAEMGRDGGWGEGATYTTLAWMCATKFMAALHNVSDGRDNLFDDPRLRQAHLYHIYLLEPDYDGFVRFSNCGRGVHRHGDERHPVRFEGRLQRLGPSPPRPQSFCPLRIRPAAHH